MFSRALLKSKYILFESTKRSFSRGFYENIYRITKRS